MLKKYNAKIAASLLIIAGFLFLAAGCTAKDIPLLNDKRDAKGVLPFKDIPAPLEMTVDERQTSVIEVRGVKSGTVVLTGYVKEASLIKFYKEQMPKYGWQFQNMFTGDRTTLIYRKNNRSAMIAIKENILKTVVEIKSSHDK